MREIASPISEEKETRTKAKKQRPKKTFSVSRKLF